MKSIGKNKKTKCEKILKFKKEKNYPFVNYIPEPTEATINSLKTMIARKLTPGNMGLSNFEPPSCFAAIEMYFKIAGIPPIDINVHIDPTADPRQPYANARYTLWKLGDTFLVPAMENPKEEIENLVIDIAREKYSISDWKKKIKKIGSNISTKDIEDLLATMVNIPINKSTQEFSTWMWIIRVQIAAALLIASTEKTWEGSKRKEALLSLIYGPPDWVGVAGIVALTEIVIDQPEYYKDIIEIFSEMIQNHPNFAWTLEFPLMANVLRIPSLDKNTRKMFEEYLKKYFSRFRH